MFENNSRYHYLDNAVYRAADGQQVVYKRRRFLPQGDSLPVLAEVAVGSEDRLDQIAASMLGDPEQYWQICDANNALNPASLTDRHGRSIRVPVPQFQELDPASLAQGGAAMPFDSASEDPIDDGAEMS